MKRLAAIFVVAAAFSGVAPVGASAAPLGTDACHAKVWPLNLLLLPYCE